MHRINFIDIANLCAHFTYLKKNSFSYLELRNLFSKCRIFTFPQSFNELIEVCSKLQIIIYSNEIISITPIGLKLAYLHKSIKPYLDPVIKEYFIKGILFNLELNEYCPASFLDKFQPDTTKGTFIFERTMLESYEETNWLINLNSVGLLEVNRSYASIRPEYLEILNILLRDFRAGPSDFEKDEEIRNQVGEFAEEKAMEYEENRLNKNGFKELSKLIQRISLVDKYAGYDILSFVGKGKFPDPNIYIEVKGTTDNKIKFIWTGNEIKKAKIYKSKYYIYSYWNINLSTRSFEGPEVIKNPIRSITDKNYISEPIRLYIEKK